MSKLQHGKQVAAWNGLLRRLHRGSDDRLVSGHGDAFADRRHSSGGSRAHRVDEAPAISRPACRRHRMLCRTCSHDGMCRRLCAASLAWPPVRLASECALAMSFPGMHRSRGPHVARYPARHGIQWRVLPACAGGGRLAALSSPTVVSVSDNENAAHKSHSQQWVCH